MKIKKRIKPMRERIKVISKMGIQSNEEIFEIIEKELDDSYELVSHAMVNTSGNTLNVFIFKDTSKE